MIINDKNLLLQILKKKSVSYGDFILSSGKKSTYYVDAKLTTLDAKGAFLIGRLFFQELKPIVSHISAVGGLTMGADPITISTILAAHKEGYNLKAFSVRKTPKSHGKKKLIEGNLDDNDNVVIIDDVITTGGSTLQAIKAVEDFGANIFKVIALVDRCEGGREKIKNSGYDIQSLFTINDLLEPSYLIEDNLNEYREHYFSSEEGLLQAQFS